MFCEEEINKQSIPYGYHIRFHLYAKISFLPQGIFHFLKSHGTFHFLKSPSGLIYTNCYVYFSLAFATRVLAVSANAFIKLFLLNFANMKPTASSRPYHLPHHYTSTSVLGLLLITYRLTIEAHPLSHFTEAYLNERYVSTPKGIGRSTSIERIMGYAIHTDQNTVLR